MAYDLEFGVSFEKAIAGANGLNARIANLAVNMDKVEAKSAKVRDAYGSTFTRIQSAAEKAAKALTKMGNDGEAAGQVMEKSAQRQMGALQRVADGYVDASFKANAWTGSAKELQAVLSDTANLKAFSAAQERLASLQTRTAGEIDLLTAKLNQLESEQGQQLAQLKAQVAAKERAAKADVNQRAKLEELRAEYQRLGTAEAREIEVLKMQIRERRKHIQNLAQEAEAYESASDAMRRREQVQRNQLAITEQLVNAEREMAVTGEKLAWGYERLTQEQAHFTAQQRRAKEAIESANRSMVEGEQNLHRYTGANARAAQAAERLAREEKSAASARKRELAELRRDIEERSRLKEQEQAGYARQANADAIAQDEAKRRRELEQLRRAIEERYKADDKSRETLERLGRAEADYQAKLERVNRLIELRNQATMERARASQGLTRAQAREAHQLRENIELYQRQARYAAMTNAQLLGLSKGHDKVSRDMHLNAQAAAMFRAGLGGLNASIGIYTSSTVLAASVTYAFAAALRNTVSAGMEFTEMMSRAEAIMMTGTDSLTQAGRSMEALELQVRALGQSTVFTATEVAGGLVDLGMAGLSAADAMRALKPALDLASIGGIDMSKSADIATNVMTAFKLEAKDLTGVVDILATAVTNSNTNIEQMANALSYVGPAAKAAGFDLKDTVAAIELLSNAGIKSSKAGTGLRRLMLNLQNPTTKGAKVLERYGIGLQDAEGNTRDLIDILKQFNTALHRDGITPSERMAAIVDLVGVRAASAVSRMVGSVDELAVFRRGLDNAAGAAEEMRQKIEDNLTADWKQVKSSFQELQLEVFEEFQWHLRSTSAALTDFFQTLTVEGEGGVSRLDEIIGLMAQLGDVSQGALLAFGSYKGGRVGGTMLGALGNQAEFASERLKELSRRSMIEFYDAQTRNTRAIKAGSMAMQGSSATALLYHGSLMQLSRGMAVLSAATMRVARVASIAMRAFGWVGIVWGIYDAITSAFGGTDKYVDAHKQRIQDLQTEYGKLQEQIELTQQKKNREALETQLASDREELGAINSRTEDLELLISTTDNPASKQALEDRLFLLSQRQEALTARVRETNQALGNMALAAEDVASMDSQQGFLVEQMANARRELNRLDEAFEQHKSVSQLPEFFGWDDMPEDLREAREDTLALMAAASSYFAMVNHQAKEAESNHRSFVQSLEDALSVQREQMAEERRFEQLSIAEKILDVESRLAEKRAEVAAMDQADEQYADKAARAIAEAEELNKQLIELRYELQDVAAEGTDTYNQLLELQDQDEKSIQDIRAALAALNVERMSMLANAVVGGGLVDSERMVAILEEQIGLTKELTNLRSEEQRGARRVASEAAREAERKLNEARSLFDSLRGDFDPIGKALDKHRDQMAMLDSLRHATGENAISQEEYNLAVSELGKRLRETITDADPFLARLKDIREEYGATLNTLSSLGDDRQFIQDHMKGAERDLMTNEVDDRFREEVLSGAPTVDGLDSDVGGAWSELDRLNEQDAAQEAWYQKQLERHRQYLDTKEGYEDEYSRAVKELTKWRGEQVSQIEKQEQITRLQAYGETANFIAGLTQQSLDIVKYAAGESSAAYKAMFLANKAAALAEAVVNTEAAAIKALTIDPTGALSTVTRALGYTSIGIMAGQALTQTFGGGSGESSEAPSANFSGMYDTGGTIPRGSYGIVGEVGPEIVHGPAQVTGRKQTERQLSQRGGGDHIEFKPVIQVTVEGGKNGDQDPEETGRLVGKQVEAQVMQLFHREMRPNGVLDRWKRS